MAAKYLKCPCCCFLVVMNSRDDHTYLECPQCKSVKCGEAHTTFEELTKSEFEKEIIETYE